MSNLDTKSAIANKLLNPNGSVTTIDGQSIVNPVDSYKSKPSIPNKFLNPDGTYSTIDQIINNMIDTSIFIVVDTLPKTGQKNKIYLVPSSDGKFDEYYWNDNNQWDKIGEVVIDLSDYPTIEQMQEA